VRSRPDNRFYNNVSFSINSHQGTAAMHDKPDKSACTLLDNCSMNYAKTTPPAKPMPMPGKKPSKRGC